MRDLYARISGNRRQCGITRAVLAGQGVIDPDTKALRVTNAMCASASSPRWASSLSASGTAKWRLLIA